MGRGSRKARTERRAQEKRQKVREVFVGRPFEGLAAESELIAMREFVPSGTAPLALAGGVATGDVTEVTVCTVLPGAAAAMLRTDGTALIGLQVQTRSSDVSRDVGRSLRWVLQAAPGDVLTVPDTTSPPADGERLQDLIDPAAALTPQLHKDFAWWLPEDSESSDDVKASLVRANAAILPTERIGPAAYWVLAGEKAHLRWVRSEPEDDVLSALARLGARGELGLGAESRFAGSFRAHGLLVPVWDLDPEAHAKEWIEPAEQLGVRLEEALASLADQPLNAEERRARHGLIGRQLTIR